MNRLLLALGIALCLPACATVSTHSPVALKSVPVGLSESEKHSLYLQHSVSPTQNMTSLIGYSYYSDQATLTYFDASGASNALELQQAAIKTYRSGRKVEIESLAAGLLLGTLGGTVYGQQADRNNLPGHSVFTASLAGLILGGVSGTLVGLGIWNWNYQPRAQAQFSKACDTFNKQLASKLQMEINPTLSGISGTFHLNF